MVSAAAWAQPTRDDVLQLEQRQRADQTQAAQRTAPTASDRPRLPRAQWPETELPCIVIRALQLTEAAPAWPGRLRAELADEWRSIGNRCLGEAGLHTLRQHLDARVREAGWITSRVEFPEQNLSAGTVTVAWVPGVAGAVSALGAGSIGIAPGQVLTLADLDHAIEAFNRMPSLRAKLLLVPGALPDTHDLVIQADEGRSWQAAIALDNTAAGEYGGWQSAGRWTIDRPSRWAGGQRWLDQLQVDLAVNAQARAASRLQWSAAVIYTLPVGRHDFGASLRDGAFARRVQGTTVDFVNRGADRARALRWGWTPWRDGTSRWQINAEWERAASRRHIDDVELLLQRKQATAVQLGFSAWRRIAIGHRPLELRADVSSARA